MTGRIDSRLKELGIVLPAPPAPVASYVPQVTVDSLVFISGQVTLAADGLKFVGIVGKDLSVEQGHAAARLVRHQTWSRSSRRRWTATSIA